MNQTDTDSPTPTKENVQEPTEKDDESPEGIKNKESAKLPSWWVKVLDSVGSTSSFDDSHRSPTTPSADGESAIHHVDKPDACDSSKTNECVDDVQGPTNPNNAYVSFPVERSCQTNDEGLDSTRKKSSKSETEEAANGAMSKEWWFAALEVLSPARTEAGAKEQHIPESSGTPALKKAASVEDGGNEKSISSGEQQELQDVGSPLREETRQIEENEAFVNDDKKGARKASPSQTTTVGESKTVKKPTRPKKLTKLPAWWIDANASSETMTLIEEAEETDNKSKPLAENNGENEAQEPIDNSKPELQAPAGGREGSRDNHRVKEGFADGEKRTKDNLDTTIDKLSDKVGDTIHKILESCDGEAAETCLDNSENSEKDADSKASEGINEYDSEATEGSSRGSRNSESGDSRYEITVISDCETPRQSNKKSLVSPESEGATGLSDFIGSTQELLCFNTEDKIKSLGDSADSYGTSNCAGKEAAAASEVETQLSVEKGAGSLDECLHDETSTADMEKTESVSPSDSSNSMSPEACISPRERDVIPLKSAIENLVAQGSEARPLAKEAGVSEAIHQGSDDNPRNSLPIYCPDGIRAGGVSSSHQFELSEMEGPGSEDEPPGVSDNVKDGSRSWISDESSSDQEAVTIYVKDPHDIHQIATKKGLDKIYTEEEKKEDDVGQSRISMYRVTGEQNTE